MKTKDDVCGCGHRWSPTRDEPADPCPKCQAYKPPCEACGLPVPTGSIPVRELHKLNHEALFTGLVHRGHMDCKNELRDEYFTLSPSGDPVTCKACRQLVRHHGHHKPQILCGECR